MRTETIHENTIIESLSHLDALVGERVMGEHPIVHWVDSYSNQRFASLEEALEAMRDPYYQRFIPEESRARSALVEVREFPCYSTNITLALAVVERYSACGAPLHLRQKNCAWYAAFGEGGEARAGTAPVAICLAALRYKGYMVELGGALAAATV